MLSKWKIIGLVALCFLVAGCEFQPLYGPDSPRETYLNQTGVTVTGNLDPEKLASVLRDQFGKVTGDNNYHLTVDFVISDESGPIQGSGDVYQYLVVGSANIAFFDLMNGGDMIYSGTINERARWTSVRDGNISEKEKQFSDSSSLQVLANLDARDDALNRLRRLIVDRIYSRVIAIQPVRDEQS